MRLLAAIGGAAIEEFLARVAARVEVREGDEWVVLHVIDPRPLEEVTGLGRGLLGRGRRAEEMMRRMRDLAAENAGEELAVADRWLAARGIPHRVVGRTGRPEREIVAAAEDEGAELIVLGAGLGLGPGPGAHPLSPIARFVVDHALCDVLLLRPPEHRAGDAHDHPRPHGPHGPHGPHPHLPHHRP
ncbi:MAG TPA: universal stress protein [Thermomicrobiales bacterium]|nr:universal stress protein [Thermomicrobiales bacterium]